MQNNLFQVYEEAEEPTPEETPEEPPSIEEEEIVEEEEEEEVPPPRGTAALMSSAFQSLGAAGPYSLAIYFPGSTATRPGGCTLVMTGALWAFPFP